MRHDTAPARLPYVLLVALEEPPALGREHLQDLGSLGRRALDGADRVDIGEPRDAGSRQDGALGVFAGLRKVGGEALFRGHATN